MVSEHEKRLDDARTYEGEAYKDFMIQLENKGFESVEAYELGKLSDENVLAKQKQVEAYTKEKSALISQKEQLEKESKQLQVVDIEVYEKRLYQRKEDRVKLDETFNQKKYRYEHNQKILELVGSYQSQIGEKEAKYAVLGNLAQVAQGNNPLRISFERYVLAAFLEDVLTAANMRLTKMTFGRYSLHRSDDLERKNRQSGLELQVFDNYTGKMRHVKTLSGGESFKTSLAMALGLSDVVQSYTGGIQLDTMFVDEGFGTLDQESLDSAINCLVDLQKRGRLIGIISHVQELKERIESRLEIYSTQTGSRTEFV
jgi:exonuclease SbcC